MATLGGGGARRQAQQKSFATDGAALTQTIVNSRLCESGGLTFFEFPGVDDDFAAGRHITEFFRNHGFFRYAGLLKFCFKMCQFFTTMPTTLDFLVPFADSTHANSPCEPISCRAKLTGTMPPEGLGTRIACAAGARFLPHF